MNYLMSFDVESAGLHGEGFAVGWVVIDLETSEEVVCGYEACPYYLASGEHAWIEENVVPHLEPETCASPHLVRTIFCAYWQEWKAKGAMLMADCAWPVEARFLADCVKDRILHAGDGPYPLFDVSTMLLAAGMDPVGDYGRLQNELPAHHPTNDARQSARVWMMAREKLFSRVDKLEEIRDLDATQYDHDWMVSWENVKHIIGEEI